MRLICVHDYRVWLRKAVEGHSIPAALAAYREDLPSICDVSDAKILANDPVGQGMKEGSCPLLDDAMQAAVKAGSLNAMVALGVRSIWKDSPDAYMYAYAYVAAAAAGLRKAQEQGVVDNGSSTASQQLIESEKAMYARWLHQFSSKLSAEQQARAQTLSQQILNSTSDCCQLFPRELSAEAGIR